MFIWVIVVFILALFAQWRVSSAFKTWSQVQGRRGLTGAGVARKMLDRAGLSDVPVNQVEGSLTDHYDPVKRTLNLSESVYASDSVAALGVAAHEAGHAIQHKTSFLPLALRNGIYPLARIGSMLSYPIFIFGIILSFNQLLIQIGIWLFGIATLFTVITLPVEFDASRKAKLLLVNDGYLAPEEMRGVNAVLDAAALTYVAAALSSIINLLRMLALGRSRD
jgi:Zn-dependent membrane protease YugP